jgi:hypothetical protein
MPPLAVLSSLLVAGLFVRSGLAGGIDARPGATNGLRLKSRVPPELGGAMIAMMILFVSYERLYRGLIKRVWRWVARQG